MHEHPPGELGLPLDAGLAAEKQHQPSPHCQPQSGAGQAAQLPGNRS